MSLPLLLLLLVCGSQASHFFGTTMTFQLKHTSADGSVSVVLRYKLNFRSCTYIYTWDCLSGDCGTESFNLWSVVDEESSGEWCQWEVTMTWQVPTNAPFQLLLTGKSWIDNIRNGISRCRAVTLVDLRTRSDTGQANRSPQTTILPALRVPSNCQRNFHLLAFDPDGDKVKCRYGSTEQEECDPCTPPSVLSLSTPCTLSFASTSSSNEGAYAVQLVMEDFPEQNILLRHSDGSETARTTSDALSKLPVQFALRVDPAVPSCTEGHYLPKFLPPTPENGAQLYVPVGQTLKINISAEATNAVVSELLFSGPTKTGEQNTEEAGHFILTWTPSEKEDGEHHPICFVVQAVNSPNKYHSELRCVIVSVIDEPITRAVFPTTTIPITTPLSKPLSTTTIISPSPATLFLFFLAFLLL